MAEVLYEFIFSPSMGEYITETYSAEEVKFDFGENYVRITGKADGILYGVYNKDHFVAVRLAISEEEEEEEE